MQKINQWLEKVYDRRAKQQYDAVVPIVADEGKGKSTLILQITWLWQQFDGNQPTPDSVLDTIVWSDREEFKEAISSRPKRSVIAAHDAARVLHKREAMYPDQIEVEKDLLDVRRREYLMLLGFQEWDVVPTQLQKRRATFLLRIPRRGIVEGYSRKTIDKKVSHSGDSEWWPEPDLRDNFDSLDGTDLWERFEQRDEEEKAKRMGIVEETDGDEGPTPQEVVAEIRASGTPADYIQYNEFNEQAYFDDDLIQFDYPELSNAEAEQVKKALNREYDAYELHQGQEVTEGGEGASPTP